MTEKNVLDAKRIYGMVTNIDDNVGKLVSKLKELNIDQNTILIFMTDNGPQQFRYVSNLRGLKSSVYNGGIKVPFYLSYPKIHDAGLDIDNFSAHIDVLPSLLDLCDIETPKNIKIDGKNFLNKSIEERSFFSYWTRKSPELYQNMSLNKGNYKLVGNTNYDSPIERFELFDIDNDPYEMENLIENKKELAIQMKLEMDNIYNELINSKNIKNKPRIIIGSEFENPTYLNRNDASGQRGIWAQNEIFGFWRIKALSGKYNFRFKFNNLNLTSGQMVIEVGNQVFSKKVEVDDNGYALMENIDLNEGEFDLTPFFRYERKNIFPFWVEIDRL